MTHLNRTITPDNVLKAQADTVCRSRFLEAYDHKDDGGWVTMDAFCEKQGVPRSTAYD